MKSMLTSAGYVDYGRKFVERVLPYVQANLASGTLVDAATVVRLAETLGVDQLAARRAVWLSGARPEPAAAIILTGGKSKRMGTDKAFLLLDGLSAAARLHQKLIPHFDEVIFAAAASQPSPVAGARCVYDTVAGQGPLAGLASGLSASPCRVNFVIACDIPEIDILLMRRLLSCLEQYEIAVPAFTPRRTEPLFGAYDRMVGPTARLMIEKGFLQVLSVYAHHRTQIVAATGAGWYANLNTPADLQRYLGDDGERRETAAGSIHPLHDDSGLELTGE